MGKVILLTGASSGMGREAALLLARKGHTVYAGARRVERMEDLAEHGVVPVEMDVAKSNDNHQAVNRIMEREGRIDVLINNAGFGLFGPVEDVPLDEARYQFDPFGAWYHATKHALEGWSDCLRIETAPHNIQVVVVEPGFIKTEFNQGLENSLGKYCGDSAYKPHLDAFIQSLSAPRVRDGGTDPKELAQVFAEAATTARPRRRYVKGDMAQLLILTRRWFGDGVYEFLLRRSLQ